MICVKYWCQSYGFFIVLVMVIIRFLGTHGGSMHPLFGPHFPLSILIQKMSKPIQWLGFDPVVMHGYGRVEGPGSNPQASHSTHFTRYMIYISGGVNHCLDYKHGILHGLLASSVMIWHMVSVIQLGLNYGLDPHYNGES